MLARLQSKHNPQPVIIVRRFEEDSGTGVVATFRGGVQYPGLQVPSKQIIPPVFLGRCFILR